MVIGLDGVPYSFLAKQFKEGNMPRLKKLSEEGMFKSIHSTIPYVSSSAWACYMTGEDASGHNIHGFIDRHPKPFKTYCPSSIDLGAEPLWHTLSRQGKKVIVINVPVTFPPQPVNGVLISGFLCPQVDLVAYPQELSHKLKDMDYRIDADVELAHKDKYKFLDNIYYTLEKRFEVAEWLLHTHDWDFLQLHIMETDRMNHFYWQRYMQEDTLGDAFITFYNYLDQRVGNFIDRFGSNCELLILSDHGFCTLKKEMNVNTWLKEKGLLKFTSADEHFETMSRDTKVYHFYPGRFFINTENREEMGSVALGSEYGQVQSALIEELKTLKDPDTGELIIKKVWTREELYNGAFLDNCADVLALSFDGYDLKGGLNQTELMKSSTLEGMHTFDDAFALSRGKGMFEEVKTLKDFNKVIIEGYN